MRLSAEKKLQTLIVGLFSSREKAPTKNGSNFNGFTGLSFNAHGPSFAKSELWESNETSQKYVQRRGSFQSCQNCTQRLKELVILQEPFEHFDI